MMPRTPAIGPVWCMGATTRCFPGLPIGELTTRSTNSTIDAPPGNIWSGNSTPLGSPVVPEV